MLATHQVLQLVPPRRHVTDDRFFLVLPLSLPPAPEADLLVSQKPVLSSTRKFHILTK